MVVFSPSVALFARQLPRQREPWALPRQCEKLKFTGVFLAVFSLLFGIVRDKIKKNAY